MKYRKKLVKINAWNFYRSEKIFKMMKFIYDSLDTVKSIKHPTKKDYINITIAIFIVVIIAAFYFIGTDTLFSSIYKFIYHSVAW